MENNEDPIENDETELVPRLSKGQVWAYGVGHVLNDICASMWFTYFIVFFHFVLGFDPVLSGLILMIGQVADALATPFVGLNSDSNDNSWLCRYGKRKTWHLMGSICVILSFPFIFSRCIKCENADPWAQLFYYSVFVIIFQWGWASVQISHLAMIPDLTPIDNERTELTAIRFTFTVFSNIFVYCVTWGVLHISGDGDDNSSFSPIGPKDSGKFQLIVLIGVSIGILATIVFHICVKEVFDSVTGPTRQNPKPVSSFFRDTQFYLVAGVYMSTRLFVNISQIYIPMYLHESLKMPATSLAVIPLIMYMSGLKVSLIIQRLNTKMGRKLTYFIGVVLGLSSCTWIFFGHGEQFINYQIYPVSLLLGAGGSIMLVTSLGITADLIGKNPESGAFVYGAMSFTDKLCNGLVVMIIQYTRCSSNCPMYYRDVLSFVCGGSAIFGFMTMFGIRAQRLTVAD